MKQIQKLFKLFTLVMAMVAIGSTNAYAGSSKNYYAKATAAAVGNGKVYVGKSNSAPADAVYSETTELSNSASSTGNSANVDFYLFAETGDATTKFDGWYDNAECTGTALSTNNPYNAKISSNSTDQNSPVTKTYYAKFVEATVFYSSTFTVSCVGEGGSVAVSIQNSNEDFGTQKNASNLNDVEPAHTYYLQAKVSDANNYRFLGWYSDEVCETLLSKNADYTYIVTAKSQDEANPTDVRAYAKFEKIPYYFSCVTATAVGAGKVNVSSSSKAGEYNATSNATQKIADKAAHTYYLNAQVDGEEIEFDGWFSDVECTNKLSEASSYTYKVTSTSLEETTATAFNVYAKFTARNMYQVRNAGFEKWAAANEPGFGWNSFPSAVGSQASLGKGLSPNPEKVEGRNGGSAVRLFSKNVVLANANGNLTTGIVNMGSTTPTNAANHNYTDTEKEGHYLIIAGQPDGVEFYTKYKKGQTGEYNGHAQFIIHDKYNYRDPEVDEEQEHKIASCGVDILESEDWVRNTGDISYIWEKDAAAATTKYLLINFTTNQTPGGSKDDELIIDDVRLIYNSELASATIGENVVEFIDGAATVDAYYNAEVLTLTSNGRAATIETSYNAGTGVLTITVKGQDYEADNTNVHVYTIQYNPAKANMTIGNAGYATFVAPFEVAELPDGVKAYTVSDIKENGVTLNLVETSIIEANTPVILEGASVNKTFYGVFIPATVEAGLLTGVYEDTPAPVGSYVLQNKNGVVGMYQVAAGQQPTVKANRCYLTTTSGVKAFFFEKEDAVDAINGIQAEETDGEIYNLAGQRMNKMVKGINIINGKKILK